MKILTYPDSAVFRNTPHLEGKFLRLSWVKEEHLVLALRELHQYHNQILGQFLSDRGVPHRWAAPDRLEADHPDLWVIRGGRFRIDREAGRLHLWDNSQTYGRFRESGLREGLAAVGPPWSGLQLVVD